MSHPLPFDYILPAALLQAVVDYLNAQPAGAVRPLLNAIEAECLRQDTDRQAAPAVVAPGRRRKPRNEAVAP